MKMILVLSTSTGKASTEMLTGVREFAQGTDWNIQSIEFNGNPFPVRDLIRFWSPVGCIVEASGNGLQPGMIPHRAFGTTPVVYIGGDTTLTPKDATCVTHNAVAVGEAAARELLTLGFSQFAFIGWKGHAWSELRKDAFAAALKLNGRDMSSIDLPSIEKGLPLLKRWLAPLPKPCGILAANDAIAEMTLTACRLLSISVPDEVAVIGVDDDEAICEHTVPTLTSIHPDFRQGGRFAARLLARKLHHPADVPSKTSFSISGIVRRGSTRLFKRRDDCVSAALERIWRPDGAKLTPKEILASFPCSRRSAEIRFRQATGHAVLEELQKARIHQAKQLLATTNLPVSAIAENCGYASLAHFRDTFRKEAGANPLTWRKSHREARGQERVPVAELK